MAYVFAEAGDERVISRFFFTQAGSVREDPATGSATANFGAWCLAMNRPPPVRLRISQGQYCGRPSTLYLDVDSNRRIFVGGDVVEIGAGAITSL
jgi:predicted PhzF superfamily epimerase YddE/YHI9